MINRRIAMSGMSILAALALAGTATFAFFTDNATSEGNTFSTGTLDVSITDQNSDTAFEGESIVSNWAPGEEALVNFDVKNVGTLPVQLRGFATGTWGNSGLDSQDMVRVTRVERWNGAAWETLLTDSDGIDGLFYYTNDGTQNGTFFDVAPGGKAQFRLPVELDEDAGNDFQDSTLTSTLTVQARQVTSGALWP